MALRMCWFLCLIGIVSASNSSSSALSPVASIIPVNNSKPSPPPPSPVSPPPPSPVSPPPPSPVSPPPPSPVVSVILVNTSKQSPPPPSPVASTIPASSPKQLSPGFYHQKCPSALLTINALVTAAVRKEPRMGASLLRLHFHDCFVQGCDASVLLKDTPTFKGEQSALPNINSLRGFNVIDNIKTKLEKLCPGVVSCSDIVATAARDSVVALGGPFWDVRLGRRDSTTASISSANTDLPSPFLDLSGLIAAFAKKQFTVNEMVALSGAHTIGQARCVLFRPRIYNESNISPSYARSLKAHCPQKGGDTKLSPIDSTTPNFFDSAYYRNLVNKKGLFHSDQQLFNGGSTDSKVSQYARNPFLFRFDFANAMIKMGNLSPLTGTQGQIRKVCSRVN